MAVTRTRSQLVYQAAANLQVAQAGQDLAAEDYQAIDAYVDPMRDRLASKHIYTIPDLSIIDGDVFFPLSIILAEDAAPWFGKPTDQDKKALAEQNLILIRRPPALSGGIPSWRTRTELVAQAASDLGVGVAGEDIIDGLVVSLVNRLQSKYVYTVANLAQIPLDAFWPLARLLAQDAAPWFGKEVDEAKRDSDEKELLDLSRPAPLTATTTPRTRAELVAQAATDLGVSVIGQPVINGIADQLVSRLAAKFVVYPAIDLTAIPQDLFRYLAILLAQEAAPFFNIQRDEEKVALAEQQLKLARPSDPLSASPATRSRTDLIAQAASELGVGKAEQPKIDGQVMPLINRLKSKYIYSLADVTQIPLDAFWLLARLLAQEAAPLVGKERNDTQRQSDEQELLLLGRAPPLSNTSGTRTRADLISQAASDIGVGAIGQPVIDGLVTSVVNRLASKRVLFPAIDVTAIPQDLFRYLSIIVAEEAAPWFGKPRDEQKISYAEEQLRLARPPDPLPATGLPRTRANLVAQAAAELGVGKAGQDIIDGYVDPMVNRLATKGSYYLSDLTSIELEAFQPLSVILAQDAAPWFHKQRDETAKTAAERELIFIRRTIPTRIPMAVEYF